MPSTKQFSEEFKVNHLTTRNALKILEREGLISMHAGRGTFVLSSKAKTAQIAVIVPNLGQQMPGEISRGMRRTISGGGEATLTFIDYQEDVEVEKECIERLRSQEFDGALYFPSLAPESIKPILGLVTSGFPLVFLDRAIEGIPCWLVASDNFAMGEVAALHLIKAGSKRPACIMSTFSNTMERLQGFRVALNNRNYALPEERVMIAPPQGDPGGELTRKLMSLKRRPDAIFYYNDYQALVGLKVVKELGLRVPEDVWLMGCDDIEASHLAIPTLTSVRQNFTEIGARSLEMLLELIRLPVDERFHARNEIVGVDLVIRESTASHAPAAKAIGDD